MKKLLFILFIVAALAWEAATITQYIGSPTTLLENKGWLKVDKVDDGSNTDSVAVFHNGVFRRVGPMGFYAQGPYLIGSRGAVVGTMDTIRFNESALDDRINYFIGDGTVVSGGTLNDSMYALRTELQDTAAAIRASISTEVFAPYTVTYSATPTFNYVNSVNQQITLTGNATVSFSNIPDGKILYLLIIQDATGGRTVSWPAGSKIVGGSLTLTTTANAWDLVGIKKWGSSYLITYGKDFK